MEALLTSYVGAFVCAMLGSKEILSSPCFAPAIIYH